MKKTFYSNLAFLLFVNLLVKPFWIFGIDLTVQNTVGAETYGIYFALFNFSILFQILLDFGINNFSNRAVAQDESFIKKHLPDILSLKIALSLAYAAITLLFGLSLGYGKIQMHLLLLLVGNQILSSLLLYLRSNISGMQLFKTDSILSVLDRLVTIIICSWLLWGSGQEFKIEWFIYAQSASLLFSILVAAAIVMSKHGMITMRWDLSGMKDIAVLTYPYALLGLLMSIYYRIDGVMLERMLPDGAHESGIYAASFRLLDAASNLSGVLFAAILLPTFARMISKKEDVQSLANASFGLIMMGALSLVGLCYFFRAEIIHLLYPQATEYWSDIFGMLMPAFLGICTVYIYGSLLTANGNVKILNFIALGGMLLNIILNLILIPDYKAMGATIATLITQTLVAVAHFGAARAVMRKL